MPNIWHELTTTTIRNAGEQCWLAPEPPLFARGKITKCAGSHWVFQWTHLLCYGFDMTLYKHPFDNMMPEFEMGVT